MRGGVAQGKELISAFCKIHSQVCWTPTLLLLVSPPLLPPSRGHSSSGTAAHGLNERRGLELALASSPPPGVPACQVLCPAGVGDRPGPPSPQALAFTLPLTFEFAVFLNSGRNRHLPPCSQSGQLRPREETVHGRFTQSL